VLKIPFVIWAPNLVGNMDFTVTPEKAACIVEEVRHQLLVRAKGHSQRSIIV
jgi:hypothetical protein